MRDQLIQYVNLLFAGTSGANEIKQEILQNTLDRYDDLLSQGKTPQAAYQQAISGIGDIGEILSSQPVQPVQHAQPAQSQPSPAFPSRPASSEPVETADDYKKKLYKAVAIALFILSAIPLILLEDAFGLCICLAMVAAGVGLLVATGKESKEDAESEPVPEQRRSALNRGITGGIWGVTVPAYLLVSFLTGDWHITWMIFPIVGCLCGLIDAIFDLNKKLISAIIRIVIFCMLLFVLTASVFGVCWSFSLDEGFFVHDSSTGSYTLGEGQVDAAQVKNIEIEWVAGSIRILPADTQVISFSEAAKGEDAKPMRWEIRGETLYIQFCEPTMKIGLNFGTTFNSVSKELTISVPNDWVCKDLSIDSVSANIDVEALVCDTIDLTNVSGKCTFMNCNTGDVSLETVSGGVEYRGGLNSLDCSSVSADCEIYALSHPSSIDLEGVSCDLTLYLPETCGFTVDTESASGDFESDFATTVERGLYVYGDGKCRVNAESVSGDIIIRKAG